MAGGYAERAPYRAICPSRPRRVADRRPGPSGGRQGQLARDDGGELLGDLLGPLR